jgi:hypothetical protein
MTVEAFIDLIVERAEALSASDAMALKESVSAGNDRLIQAEKITDFWKQVNSFFSGEMMTQPLYKKTAARIIHIFMKDVLDLPDLDWQGAANLRDIYECRVCANAIAQVYERGIIPSRDNEAFGINDEMSDELIADAINKLFA